MFIWIDSQLNDNWSTFNIILIQIVVNVWLWENLNFQFDDYKDRLPNCHFFFVYKILILDCLPEHMVWCRSHRQHGYSCWTFWICLWLNQRSSLGHCPSHPSDRGRNYDDWGYQTICEGGRGGERDGESEIEREHDHCCSTPINNLYTIILFVIHFYIKSDSDKYLGIPGEASGADEDRTVVATPALLLEAVRVLVPIFFFPRAVESEARRWLSRSLEGPKNALPALVSTTGAVWILQECYMYVIIHVRTYLEQQ